MDLISKLVFGSGTTACDTEDTYNLLIAVLPAFYDLADRIWRRLDDAGDDIEIQDFYLHFRAKIFNLKAVLVVWDPSEIVQDLLADVNEFQKNLLRILGSLETRFLSWKGNEVRLACERLKLERKKDETYSKLRALGRILPEDGNLDEDFMRNLAVIIRIDNKRADKRVQLLQNLDQALGFLYNIPPSPAEVESSCLKRFSDYPSKHVRKFTNALFAAIQRNSSCQCPTNRSQVDRKTRLNLTRHQRFDTAPSYGEVIPNTQVDFRILFPISSRAPEWQDTRISVNNRDYNRLASLQRAVAADAPEHCAAPMPQLGCTSLNEPHCFPDILSLGILLLEIARGTPVEYQDSQDRCVVALQCLDKWTSSWNSCFWTVPDGLCRAISACIDPVHLRGHGLDRASVRDSDVRKYIFEMILSPLEDALSHPKTTREPEAFDDYEKHRLEKCRAANDWRKHLEGRNGVHDLVGNFQDLCETISEVDEKSTHVGIAVLDTGLQLPAELQENYKAAGRIKIEQSESFLSDENGTVNQDWGIDCDGHGTCVGQIIFDVAPVADVHIARVFKSRADLSNPNMASQIHKRIAKAINRATTEWKVDVIVISFGFDEPIPLIRDAIEKASKTEKAPLFFAATRNDGAHKNMAWPARDPSVIGISSTDGYGSPSSFNPSENNFHPVLYAFGEGVPVKVPAFNKPQGHVSKHVSGTSYAAPTAAALAANVLGCVRMAVKTSSPENQCIYNNLPLELQRMTGMLAVLRHRMSKEHNCGVSSLLPWDFLNASRLDRGKILEDISNTLKRY
ncbi:hypothetical protein FDECE_7608 [Fusarium decemcellulare]|nr:hypothetical protein FDECE_7608 [Fusarium decemcellulare]